MKHTVAVIGAGPAGIFAADYLAQNGINATVINRDIKPGGLAEYGIYPTKHKMKAGLRKQFTRALEQENVSYFGHVTVGQAGDVSLATLREMGFSAVLVTVGAQGTKWLGLPGEDLDGVYHAKDLVYHYNALPPFSEQEYLVGKKAAIIGVGNVMVDIAHWLVRDRHVDQVTAVARRDASAVKFTKKEMQNVISNLNREDLKAEMERISSVMREVGQDPEAAMRFILSAEKRAPEAVSNTDFRLRFLMSPVRMIGDENGRVCGLEVEHTTLKLRDDGRTSAQGTGETETLDVDTVVFAIGDSVDESFGLPTKWHAFLKRPQPRFPIEDESYEAYDPDRPDDLHNVFVAGWAREASSGLVGVARKDGRNGAAAVEAYLQTVEPPEADPIQALVEHLDRLDKPIIRKADWQKLEEVEEQTRTEQDDPGFKFASNQEMLEAIAH